MLVAELAASGRRLSPRVVHVAGAKSWAVHVCVPGHGGHTCALLAGWLAESTCTAGGVAGHTWQREAVAEWRVHVGGVGGDL